MIIDAHMHVGSKFGWECPPEAAIEMMNEVGIDKAIITGFGEVPGEDPNYLTEMVDILDKYRERFPFGFLRMNPWYGEKAVQLFVQTVEKHKNVRGLKLHPSSAPIWPHHPFTLSLIKKAAEYGCPTYIHGGSDPMSLSLQIGKAASKCPEAKIILGHFGGFFYYNDAIKVARKYKNLYLDTTAMPYPQIIRKGVDIIGAERLLFGTDQPPVSPIVELKKLELAGLTDEEKDRILCKNTAEMMGMKL